MLNQPGENLPLTARHVLPTGSDDWTATLATEARPLPALTEVDGGAVTYLWPAGVAGGQDIHGVRLDLAGHVVPGWVAGGSVLCSAPGNQTNTSGVADGGGGTLAFWDDARNGDRDLYATRILGDGTLAPGWTPDGDAVSVAPGDETMTSLISDGAGGALVFWEDSRNGNVDVYGQHIQTDAPVAVEVSLQNVTATTSSVRLEWFIADPLDSSLLVERTENGSAWIAIGTAEQVGRDRLQIEDTTIEPGRAYTYRWGLARPGSTRWLGQQWVRVPVAAEFAFAGAYPNPLRDEDLQLTFVLPSAGRPDLRIVDATGRRVLGILLGTQAAGRHIYNLGRLSLSPGVYLCEFSFEGQRQVRRLAVLK